MKTTFNRLIKHIKSNPTFITSSSQTYLRILNYIIVLKLHKKEPTLVGTRKSLDWSHAYNRKFTTIQLHKQIRTAARVTLCIVLGEDQLASKHKHYPRGQDPAQNSLTGWAIPCRSPRVVLGIWTPATAPATARTPTSRWGTDHWRILAGVPYRTLTADPWSIVGRGRALPCRWPWVWPFSTIPLLFRCNRPVKTIKVAENDQWLKWGQGQAW